MSRNCFVALVAAMPLAVLGVGSPIAAEITGTTENDVLPGTPQNDTIHGLAGNDDITPGKGNDRAFGEEGGDVFHWTEGDGRDRFYGGSQGDPFPYDSLQITAIGRLRLHIDALGAGPLSPAQEGLEAVAVTGLEEIIIRRTGGSGTIVISSDKGILPPDQPGRRPCEECYEYDDLTIEGWNSVNVSNVQASTFIYGIPNFGNGTQVRHVVKGSRAFFDQIGFDRGGAWPGDDEVWTNDGGSFVGVCRGKNIVHLGKGVDLVDTDQIECHNTVHGFESNDLLGFIGRNTGLSGIDINEDGWVDAKDASVRVRNGNMNITFPQQPLGGGRSSVTLIGVKRIRFEQFIDTCQDSGCLE